MPKKRPANSRIDDPEDDRVVPQKEAARLLGVSVDTLQKHYRHLFVRVGLKRIGLQMRDIRAIPKRVA